MMAILKSAVAVSNNIHLNAVVAELLDSRKHIGLEFLVCSHPHVGTRNTHCNVNDITRLVC